MTILWKINENGKKCVTGNLGLCKVCNSIVCVLFRFAC